MSSCGEVAEIIEETNMEWIETLKLVHIQNGVSPAGFLYTLGEYLFPDMAFPNTADDKEMLCSLKVVFTEYGIAPGCRWSPVLKLCKAKELQSDPEGIECFNNLLRALRLFFTPHQKFRKTLARNIEERRLVCQELAKEISNVTEENQFYQDKLKRIEALLTSKSGSTAAHRILEEKLGRIKRKPKKAGATQPLSRRRPIR